jgi:hypothetical protein
MRYVSLRVPNLSCSQAKTDVTGIAQDNLKDWKDTAAQMASIYENALVTLAATHAADSSAGLFAVDQSRDPKRLVKYPDLYVKERKKISRLALTYRTFEISNDSKHTQEFPLLYRAWVYQERRLSQRVIHFAQHQILWECKYCFHSEDSTIVKVWYYYATQDFRAIHTRPFGHWSGDPIADWKKTVSEFQGLRLTYESDRLPAIAALAERIMLTRKGADIYIAGMWQNSILQDLCWYHLGAPTNYRRIQFHPGRGHPYKAMSCGLIRFHYPE